MIAKFILFATILTGGKCDAPAVGECKSCKDAVANVFSMASSIMAGVDPLELKEMEVCNIVKLTGLPSIKSTGTPCIKLVENTLYFQEVSVGFDELDITCSIKTIQETMTYVGAKLPFPIPEMPKMPSLGFGKKKEEKPPQRDLRVKWTQPSFRIFMALDFERDEYNISKCELESVKFDALKLWCEGDGIMLKACEFITKPDAIKNMFGLIAQYAIKGAVTTVLNAEKIKDLLTMLNCGEPDPPSEEE